MNIYCVQRSILKRGAGGEFCRILGFILTAMVCLHSCSGKSSDGTGSATDVSSKANNTKWFANMNDAYAQSVKEQKPILAYFTESDTCGLCKQLEENVFTSSVFKDWTAANVVLLKIDFSGHDQLPDGSQEQNSGMAQYLKVTSYPTVWILNVTHEAENGRFKVKPIGKAGYEQSPERFIGVVSNYVKK